MPTTTEQDREERLDRIIADYLRALQQGQAPSRDQLRDSHPDLADELTEFFADQDRFKRLAAPLRQAAVPVAAFLPPRRFGSYELLEEIARGGMGVVYRARQYLDPQAASSAAYRLVAVKFLQGGSVASDSELRRFRMEAETVASLDHPQIIPIYEVGAHEGRWFLSMKLVEGGHLGQHRAEYRGRPNEVAELLASVADAVHHAHQRGILHRDLKPSNILLERREGAREPGWVPYVSDFGLARRLPGRGNSLSRSSSHNPSSTIDCIAPLTHTGDILGTPSYMAPEQASGKGGSATVQADVYGFWAILYELLTGRPPFQGSSQVETILKVVNEEPPRPRQLAPNVPRDLETIVLKCLHKDPARRYGSAQELAEELRRWTRGEPIHARPAGTLERWLRWVRRNKTVALLLLALLGSLLAGLGLTGWQWYRAEQHLTQAETARALAEHEREEAQKHAEAAELSRQEAQKHFGLAHDAVKTFTKRVNEELEGTPGLQQKRRRLLADALKYYEEFLKERGRTTALVRDQADTWGSLAQIHSGSGERDKAVSAYRQVVALYRELQQRELDNSNLTHRLASLLNDLAINLENLDQSEVYLQESLTLIVRTLDKDPDNLDLLASKANTLNNLAGNTRSRGKIDEVRALWESARDIQQELVRRDPRNSSYRAGLALVVRNLAVLFSHQGQHGEETLALYRQVCELQEGLAKAHPDNTRRQAELALAYQSLSTALRDSNMLQAAREPLLKTLEVRERLVKENRGVPRYLHDLAHTYISLAVLSAREGDRTKSLALNEKARDLLERLVLLDPAPRYRQELGGAWFNIGAACGALNRRADERRSFQRAREIQEELVTNYPNKMDYRCDMGRTMSNLGLNLGLARQYTDALLVLQEGLKVMRPAFEKAPEIVGYRHAMNALLGNLGEVERALNHPAESVAAFLERQELWPNNPEELYRSACEFMRAAAIVGKPRTELSDLEKAEQQRYHDQALQSLQRAVKCGCKDAERLQKEKALEPLRSRPDFQKLAESIPRSEV